MSSALFSIVAILPVILSAIAIYCHQRTYGTLDITTSSVAYDRTQYHDVLDWDKYALYVEGEPTMIFSGEFHYWRIPDRERWSYILKQYQSMGMNTIRIYFHWGYHSSQEGEYNFEGNRDIEYLLDLCEDLGLYVLAAPGPYICAETQAGGYPGWLIAKRHLRVRHAQYMLWRTYDEEFAQYEVEWLNHILPIIARHQITENQRSKRGCVLALQLDNELFETMAAILPIGLRDQMRVLAKAARDAGITIPLFSNDGFEESSWVARPELESRKGFWSTSAFGLDLYGFDKYVVFPPTSDPTSWLIDTGNSTTGWKEWSTKHMANSMDRLEKTVRAFGGGAKESPLFIPELQGGWFNHYQLGHTYDQIYDFYGDDYTKDIMESALAQGVSMTNLYMVYGGTNWGTLGDPDVYTSYDYSACIREYGYLSMRGRRLRETILFARSFDPYFTRTDRITKRTIKSTIKRTISNQRVSRDLDNPVLFTFFRNFNTEKIDLFDMQVQSSAGNFTMSCYLPYKHAFISVGNYKAANGLVLLQATVPIHLRMLSEDQTEEIWIVEPNQFGGLAFEHKQMYITGNMQDDVLRRDGPADILKFEKESGWTKIGSETGNLYIIGLTKAQVSTLYADFQDPYWTKGKKRYPGFIAWGTDTMVYDQKTQHLDINYRQQDRDLHVVSFSPPADKRLARPTRGLYYSMPYVYVTELQHQQQLPAPIHTALSNWQARTVKFVDMQWHPLKQLENGELSFDALDYHYLSGHVLYSTAFDTPIGRNVKLSLNIRHRATVLVNGHVVGGHTTYSRQLFSAGAKIGPDPWFLGTRTYDLTQYLSDNSVNTLVVLVDNFGLNRQAFIMNDVRNPRGIIKVHLSGVSQQPAWKITGTDTRELSNPYNSTGFPDELTPSNEWTPMEVDAEEGYQFMLNTSQGAQWVQFNFRHTRFTNMHMPLRMHLNGSFTAFVFLNNALIARYYGNGDSPQHDFYLPDQLLQHRNSVHMLVYTWENTTADVFISGWPVNQNSGNLLPDSSAFATDASVHVVWEDALKI
ncbi:beta-galactosidase [Lichtheimia corymbifera JMRC:FSU:9682]|uniref:Beta-galactosidase n=1 Tax=Lichtheimia corymbifera JMRC:FSU:9682 TaxID=1263082 RepID=A0A068SFB1_9FUNG|nr:beta-galactosidase [Lichtheimia corymbifera JMRC:FSU:9682]